MKRPGDGVDERIRRPLRRTPASVRTRPLAAFFFGQVAVSKEQCRHPTNGHTRYLWVSTKKSAKPKHTCLLTYNFSPTNKNQQPIMAIVTGLHDKKK